MPNKITITKTLLIALLALFHFRPHPPGSRWRECLDQLWAGRRQGLHPGD